MKKLKQYIWCYYMGMIDTYDYIVGYYPAKPDDKITIEAWAKGTKDGR